MNDTTPATPVLTENDRKVFKHYLSFKRQSFRTSLDKTAEATGLGKRTVQRVNNKLAHLGVLCWISGHGSPEHGHKPNEYRLADEIIAATGPTGPQKDDIQPQSISASVQQGE